MIDDIPSAQPIEYIEQVVTFTPVDFEHMFSRSGLQLQKLCGDYQLNQYDNKNSPRLIMIQKNNFHKLLYFPVENYRHVFVDGFSTGILFRFKFFYDDLRWAGFYGSI